MSMDRAVLIRGANLTNAAQLVHMFGEARRYFAEFALPLPPLPDNVADFVGCDLLITETRGANRERLGKVTLTTPGGDVRYERDWVIASEPR